MKRLIETKVVRAFFIFIAFGMGANACDAGFITLQNPTSSHPLGGTYVSQTSMLPMVGNELDVIGSLTDGSQSASFSIPMQILEVGSGWGNWSAPPFSENEFPVVLWTQGVATLEINLSEASSTFGFELQSNETGLFNFTTIFSNSTTVLHSISQSIQGCSATTRYPH